MNVSFETRAIRNAEKSRLAEHDVYDDIDYIVFTKPMDKLYKHMVPVSDPVKILDRDGTTREITYADKYLAQYQAWKEGNPTATDETPIDRAPFLSPAEKAELKAFRVQSIEALSNLAFSARNKLGMKADRLVEAAQEWLAKANASASQAEVQELREELARLKAGQTASVPELPIHADENADPRHPDALLDEGEATRDLSNEEIRTGIGQLTGEKPHHKTGRAKLLELWSDATTATLEAA